MVMVRENLEPNQIWSNDAREIQLPTKRPCETNNIRLQQLWHILLDGKWVFIHDQTPYYSCVSSIILQLRHVQVFTNVTIALFTFISLQFAKRMLMGHDLDKIDPGDEGAVILGDIKTYSSLTNECIKCGKSCVNDRYTRCAQGCGRHFHRNCISAKYRSDEFVTCAICDPSKREEYCQVCGKGVGTGIDANILPCVDRCEAFVHFYCAPGGTHNYRCGICTI